MSSRIKDTLLNHEVAPPEGSWQQIATALDEAANGYRFPEKLYQLEITAPPSSWDIISQQLDEAAQEGTVAEKLYAAELTPPIAAWNHIQLALETEDAVAQPAIKRFYPFWKYAVAAIVIGFLGFAAWQFLLSPEKTAITPIASINTPELEALTHASAGIDAALNNEEESVRLNTSADPEAREERVSETSCISFCGRSPWRGFVRPPERRAHELLRRRSEGVSWWWCSRTSCSCSSRRVRSAGGWRCAPSRAAPPGSCTSP